MTVTSNPPAQGGGAQTGAEVQKHADLVSLTIDGFEVSVPKGTLIIRAAELLGIQIPRFCDHPLLDPVGRVPPVPGRDPRRRQRARHAEAGRLCTTTVADGMVVRPSSARPSPRRRRRAPRAAAHQPPAGLPGLRQGRRVPAAEPDDVQRHAESRFNDVKRTYPKPIAISSQVLLDRERCVLCARCTRFSQQVAGDPFIELFERGALQQVAIYTDQPVRELLLRQHRADLPGRRADRRGLPLPRPAVRPGVHADGVRALRVRLRAAHRPPPRQGAAPAGR
jgi:NADH-quinone oxidoreductase subunit G